ncbi:ubiquinone/menaquinone biosynthesis C-methylase UbiE [Bradyrhizobium sp. AZCC 1578]|uniref:class I SAM-dependent methyltransferase n=1 Tax=Bradyrhizobium sp. AZCC 1578 TaxID=3117027 RepID=UPI002FEF3610
MNSTALVGAGSFKRFVEACRFWIFSTGFDWYYRGFLKDGAWREAFLSHLDIRDKERILEIYSRESGVTADLASRYPNAQFTAVDIDRQPGASKSGNISFDNNHLTCGGGQFDKVICSMALHPVSPALKVILLSEMRRVMRNGGKLFVAEFDAPEQPREGRILRGTSYHFGYQTAAPHLDGTWIDDIGKAGFTHIKRLHNVRDTLSRVSIISARR